jgi:hypothetical protein
MGFYRHPHGRMQSSLGAVGARQVRVRAVDLGQQLALANTDFARTTPLKAVRGDGDTRNPGQSNVVCPKFYVPSFTMSIDTCLRPYGGGRLGYTGSRTNKGVI